MNDIKNYLVTNDVKLKEKYSIDELSKFNSKDACYVGLNGNIYNMTKYKNNLVKNKKDRILNLKCGSNQNKNLIDIFRHDKAFKYKVGSLNNYYVGKCISMVVLIVIHVSSILFINKSHGKIKIICTLIYLVTLAIILQWLYIKFAYKNPMHVSLLQER